MSSAPGALGFYAAQRHQGNWNLLRKRSDLLDWCVDAEYQRPPIGEGEHHGGHLKSQPMQLSREGCQSRDGAIGTVVKRLTHSPKEVAEDRGGEVLVANLQLLCRPGITDGPQKGRGSVLQELKRAEPGPVG